jgi:hypothetical protein
MQGVRGKVSDNMIVKKHFDKNRLILACCDESLHKKKIEEGIKILDLSSKFYDGIKMSEDDFVLLLDKAYIINAVGECSVTLLINKMLITKDQIKKIGNVPYAIVVIG